MTYGRPGKSTEIIGLFWAIHFQKCDGNGAERAAVMLFRARNLDQIPASLARPIGIGNGGALFDFYHLGRADADGLLKEKPTTCE